MTTDKNATAPLEFDNYYHIYNRGNNRENIFYTQENYQYFLKKYDSYLSDYLDTYCFCLLPNHFHLLVRIKSHDHIAQQAKRDFKIVGKYEDMQTEQWVSERFRLLFVSYSKSINKQIGRTGSLLQKPFKRIKVDQDDYFTSLVWYIHNNPVHHGIHPDIETYPWSSFQRMLTDTPSKLMKEDVIAWFGSQENYIAFHRSTQDTQNNIDPLLLE